MCEQIRALVDDSVRMSLAFPQVAEDHLATCKDCSQYASVAMLLSTTGRPPVQLPPAEISGRIAALTYAKHGFLQQFFAKPSAWVPAMGVLVIAGWLISGRPENQKVANNTPREEITSQDDKSFSVVQKVELDKPKHAISPSSTTSLKSAQSIKTTVSRPKAQPRVVLALATVGEKPLTPSQSSMALQGIAKSISPSVQGSEVTPVDLGGARLREISASSNPDIDVRVPQSSRHTVGQATLVLASSDEEADRDDLRASFQSQLNQQSDTFRSSVNHTAAHSGDSSRISVVNAPVVTGGK